MINPVSLRKLRELEWAISNLVGYICDNSCGDPECCGGPFYTEEDFREAEQILRDVGLAWDGEYE